MLSPESINQITSIIKTEIRGGIQDEMSKLNQVMAQMKTDITNSIDCKIQGKVEEATQKIKNNIFKRDSRKNLVIFGWAEMDKTSITDIRVKVLELLQIHLHIVGVRTFDIEYVRVAGKKKNVVIATLVTAELVRQAILKAENLKGSSIYISYDSSPEERQLKKNLLQHKKTLSAEGKMCKIKKQTLIVDSVAYTLQQLDSGMTTPSNHNKPNINLGMTGKRLLSVSPDESNINKKTKQGSLTSPSNDPVYQTDSEEFENTMPLDNEKNEEAPTSEGGQE